MRSQQYPNFKTHAFGYQVETQLPFALLRTESLKRPCGPNFGSCLELLGCLCSNIFPLWEKQPADELLQNESTLDVELGPVKSLPLGAQVFREANEVCGVYFPVATETGPIDLTKPSGTFQCHCFHPFVREFEGSAFILAADGKVQIRPSPTQPAQDWGLRMTSDSSSTHQP